MGKKKNPNQSGASGGGPSGFDLLKDAGERMSSFRKTDDVSDLAKAIDLYKQALCAIPTQDSRYKDATIELIDARCQLALKTQNPHDLDKAIRSIRGPSNRLTSLSSSTALALSQCYTARYSLIGRQTDLDESIRILSETLEDVASSDHLRFTFLKELGDNFGTRFDLTGELADVTNAIDRYRAARELRSRCTANDLWLVLDGLGRRLLARAHINKETHDLKEAISCHHEALEMRKDRGDFESRSLRGLGMCHKERFELENNDEGEDGRDDDDDEGDQDNDGGDSEEGGAYSSNVSGVDSEERGAYSSISGVDDDGGDSKEKGAYSSNVSDIDDGEDAEEQQQQQQEPTDDLDQAIKYYQQAMALSAATFPGDDVILAALACRLSTRTGQNGDSKSLDCLIELEEAVLRLRTVGHAGRGEPLEILIPSLSLRFKRRGNIADINRAIELAEQLLHLRPRNHAGHGAALRSLARNLDARFSRTWNIADINWAIDLENRVIELHPEGDPEHGEALGALADSLRKRNYYTGNLSDLNEAVKLGHRCLSLCPKGHPNHSVAIGILLHCVNFRFLEDGDPADINTAVDLARQLLHLCPEGHADHCDALHELGSSLNNRFTAEGDISDINAAISLGERALLLHPKGHPDRGDSLDMMATFLLSRFLHPDGDQSDIDRSISLSEERILLYQDEDARRAVAILVLARGLRSRLEGSELTSEAQTAETRRIFKCYKDASRDRSAQVLDCLFVALEWAETAAELDDPSIMEAHTQILLLLDRVVAQSHSLEQQYLALLQTPSVQKARHVAVDAAALAIKGGRLELAVRLLEQGRSVVFRQLGQFRIQLADIKFVAPDLGERFTSLSRELEVAAIANSAHGSNISQSSTKPKQLNENSEYHAARHHSNVSREWLQVVDEIRAINGFQAFLQPSSFAELQWAAEAGPVIVVNISDTRSDAIIIVRKVSRPIRVPLPQATPDNVRRLADAFGSRATELDTPSAVILLRDLWTAIVEPIAKRLRDPRLNLSFGSRIWWCPTGDAARLPLHGAGPYKRGERDMLHMYTSSYAPNLTTLIQARKARPTHMEDDEEMEEEEEEEVGSLEESESEDTEEETEEEANAVEQANGPTILLVGQAEIQGEEALPDTHVELRCIADRYAPNATVLDGPAASRERVVKALERHSWVHLACHGYRDDHQPFASYFSLRGGGLSLLDLLKTDLPKAELAVLSACHSAGNNGDLPDEFLHPAAAMMVAGFKSVVATMWALDDKVGPVFAEEFYGEMLGGKGGPKGAGHAAFAVRKAVRALGRKGVPLMQRINLVHFGI